MSREIKVRREKIFLIISMVFFILFFASLGFLLSKGGITGLVTYDEIDLVASSNGSYDLGLEGLNSLTLDGSVTRVGSTKVYLEYGNNRDLVFDSSEMRIPTNDILFDESDGEIPVRISYGDFDSDGIVSVDDIVDIKISTSFEGNYSNLCTRWEVDNYDTVTSVCYGGSSCCNFISLEPASDNWNDSFNLPYGRYDSGVNNTVSAQLLYVDYSLDPANPFEDIRNSLFVSLPVVFYEEYYSFSDVCVETCSLSGAYTDYKLVYEIDNATLRIDSVNYEIGGVNETIVNETIQGSAVINEPVKWTKHVRLSSKKKNISVRLPPSVDISLSKIENNVKKNANGKVKVNGLVSEVSDLEEGGEVIVEDEADEVEVEYYTSSPKSHEENISRGKKVTISSDVHYENILAYSNIEDEGSIVKLYWIVNGSRREVNFNGEDKNGNGLIDYISWIVPHLSNQTYEIIVIVKAEHLDSGREFIADIYNEVKELDGVWSESIDDGEYVRVTFEINLSSDRDITIYPRTVSGSPRVEVYEENGSESIAEFSSIVDDEYNTVYLTELVGTQDVFDLKIVGGVVEFDHIIDPYEQMFFEDCTNMDTQWTQAGGWATVSNRCGIEAPGANEDEVDSYFSLLGATSANVSFDYEVTAHDTSEYIRMDISNDSGTNWYTVWTRTAT